MHQHNTRTPVTRTIVKRDFFYSLSKSMRIQVDCDRWKDLGAVDSLIARNRHLNSSNIGGYSSNIGALILERFSTVKGSSECGNSHLQSPSVSCRPLPSAAVSHPFPLFPSSRQILFSAIQRRKCDWRCGLATRDSILCDSVLGSISVASHRSDGTLGRDCVFLCRSLRNR